MSLGEDIGKGKHPRYQPRRYGKNWRKYEQYLQEKEYLETIVDSLSDAAAKSSKNFAKVIGDRIDELDKKLETLVKDKDYKEVDVAHHMTTAVMTTEAIRNLTQQQKITNVLLTRVIELLGGKKSRHNTK